MKSPEEIRNQLSQLFYPEEIDWLPGRKKEWNGNLEIDMYPYIQSRAVEDRLDSVVGIQNWKTHDLRMESTVEDKWNKKTNQLEEIHLNGFTVGLSIKFDNEWVSRFNGSDLTDFEQFKGGISGSLKRVAVDWGIGRYLYRIKDLKAIVHPDGDGFLRHNNEWINFFPPRLPNWAIPGEDEEAPEFMLEELSEYYKAGGETFKEWVFDNWGQISRRACYVAIKKQQINGVRRQPVSFKDFVEYVSGDKKKKKKTKEAPKKELKKPKEEIEKEQNKTSADDIDDNGDIDIMDELGL